MATFSNARDHNLTATLVPWLSRIGVFLLLIGPAAVQSQPSPPAQPYVMHFTASYPIGDQIAIAPAAPALNLVTPFTLEAWIYLESSASGVVFGRKRSSDPNTDYTIEVGANGPWLFAASNGQPGSYTSIGNGPAKLRTWTHVAGVLDAAGLMHLYINGQDTAQQQSAGSPSSGTVPFALGTGGCQFCQFGAGMTGYLRQVRVWNRALTAPDLTAGMGKYLTGTEPGLVAYWPLDDGGNGETARDLGPQNLTLQLGALPTRDEQDPNFVRTWIVDSGPYFSIEQQPLASSFSAAYGTVLDLGAGPRDILTTNVDFAAYSPQQVHVLRNDGLGHFSDATSAVLGPATVMTQLSDHRAMKTGDFDAPGRMGVFLGEYGADVHPAPGGQSQLLLQPLAGSLVDETSYLPQRNSAVHSSSVGDVNGGGALDILVGNLSSPLLNGGPVFYMNDGTGHFTIDQSRLPAGLNASGLPAPQSPTVDPTAVLLVDVNLDGHPDVFLGTGTPVPADILLLNDGTGHFKVTPNALPPRLHGSIAGNGTVAVATADIDGDGWPDIIAGPTDYSTTDGVQLLLNNHDGTFRDATGQLPPQTNLQNYDPGTTYSWVSSITPVDLNGDGFIDLVLSGFLGQVAVWLNTGKGSFIDISDALAGLPHNTGLALVGNMAGDGHPDLFTFPEWPRAGQPQLYFVRQLKPLPAVSDLLTITASHAGNFTQGQGGAMYTLTVSNAASGSPTVGAITVTENIPAGLERVSTTGAGWSCSNNTCTRADTLSPGSAFPSITVTVNVDPGAPTQVTNQVSLTGGAAPPTGASDVTTILPLTPQGSITSISAAFGMPNIAQNTWIVIKGTNLVPSSTPSAGVTWSSAPEFAEGSMPTQLNGVSVMVNQKPAYMYFFCSAVTSSACASDQVNVLTPLDSTVGPVQIVVTSSGTSSSPFTVNMQPAAPSFPLIGATNYIVATHADNSLVGPASLSVPGYPFSPARPGETIVIYGFGFGLPNSALTNGSSSQSGALPTRPTFVFGGIQASVIFAGVISPGLYQFNVVIPSTAASGDNLVTCTYNGQPSPVGDLIAIQQ